LLQDIPGHQESRKRLDLSGFQRGQRYGVGY
jgi:hypothetical protein